MIIHDSKKLVWCAIYLCVCVICCAYIYFNSFQIFKTKTLELDATEIYTLKSGETISQEISGYSGVLKNIYVKFGTEGRINNAKLYMRLLKGKEIINEWNIDTAELVDKEYKKFTVPHYYCMEATCTYNLEIEEIYDGDNAIDLYLSAGGNTLNADAQLYDKSICYKLESISLKATCIFQVIMLIIMSSIFIIFAFNKSLSIAKKIIFVFLVTTIINIMFIDVFERINTEVSIVSFVEGGQTEEIHVGQKKKYEFNNNQCVFDILEVFFEGGDQIGLHVTFLDKDSGKIIQELDVDDNNIVGDPLTGNRALWICPESRIEKGRYEIIIENKSAAEVYIYTEGEVLNVSEIKYTRVGIYIAFSIFVLLIVYLISLYWMGTKDNYGIEKFFVLTVIFVGICNFILFAPWNVPDSGSHYLASYRLSNIIMGLPEEQYWYGRNEDVQFWSNVWGKNGNPGMLSYTDLLYNLKLKCEDGHLVDMPEHQERMEYYSLLCYWPQTLGLVIGRLLNLSAIVSVYLARLMIFVFYVWGSYNAIKNTPIGKNIFALIQLMPMSMMNSSAISYDPLVLVTTLNFIAVILALYNNPYSKKMMIQAMVWIFMIGGTKGGGYLILLPLVFILFNRDYVKKSCCTCFSIIGSGIISVLLFNILIQNGNELFQFGIEGNGKMVASYALQHPIKYLQMAFITYLDRIDTYLFDMVGSDLGWLEYTVPHYILVGLFLITIICAFMDVDEIKLEKKVKYIFELVIVLTLITTPAMLLSFTDKGSKVILGLQGRYFLPLAVILLLLLTKFSLHNIGGRIISEGTEERSSIKSKLFYTYGMLLCAALYYMMRLYLTR